MSIKHLKDHLSVTGGNVSEKEKEQLGDRTARMASAYKYKIEATLNNKRGSENV